MAAIISLGRLLDTHSLVLPCNLPRGQRKTDSYDLSGVSSPSVRKRGKTIVDKLAFVVAAGRRESCESYGDLPD